MNSPAAGSLGRALCAGFCFALAQATDPAAEAVETPSQELIRDNSFLVEEAYNQEDHVMQNISSLTGLGQDRDWLYVFTQEYPVNGQKHQLGYSVTLSDPGNAGGETGPGDSFLNYRYQLIGGGPEKVAFAPRVSLLIPTGDEQEGRGLGAFGIFVNLPLSIDFNRSLVGHTNVGAAFIPSARSATGDEADVADFLLGQSLVWIIRPEFNAVFEAIYTSEEEVTGEGTARRSSRFVINPGVRWAINRPSGLQVVPGIAVPIGLGPSRGEEAIFLYLSFEYPFGGTNLN